MNIVAIIFIVALGILITWLVIDTIVKVVQKVKAKKQIESEKHDEIDIKK